MIRVDFEGQLDRSELQNITPEIAAKIKKALRATMRRAKSDAANAVAKRYTIKSNMIKPRLWDQISGTVGILTTIRKDRRFDLIDFKVTPKGRIKRRGKYKTAEIKRGERIVRKRIWATYRDDQLYERKGHDRVPFRRVKGPRASEMLGDSQVSQKIIRLMEQRFKENFV